MMSEKNVNTNINFAQSGVIPYRKTGDGIEVLLITSVRRKKWIIPKGYIEFNLSPFESAKKEAMEEAGIIGTNETIELGFLEVTKGSEIVGLKIYSMEVISFLEDYPEKDARQRRWFSPEDAAEKIDIPDLKKMITDLPHLVK